METGPEGDMTKLEMTMRGRARTEGVGGLRIDGRWEGSDNHKVHNRLLLFKAKFGPLSNSVMSYHVMLGLYVGVSCPQNRLQSCSGKTPDDVFGSRVTDCHFEWLIAAKH